MRSRCSRGALMTLTLPVELPGIARTAAMELAVTPREKSRRSWESVGWALVLALGAAALVGLMLT
jgi:hypothetical protein